MAAIDVTPILNELYTMALQQEIEQKSKEIITDSYSMSVGEIISMYKDGDLDIHPEFQRFFRWTLSQKSRLIESFLLNFPVPPIFVYQRADGIWDIVDGLQRVSTVLEFAGVYKDENGNTFPPLALEGTKMLPSLEGKVFQNEENPESSFTDSERRFFKKAKISVNIIKKESDASGQYEVFQRLNTGGTSLSPQEVRNCMMVMTDSDKFKIVRELSEYANFRNSLSINDKAKNERFDMELVTRFICMRHENVEKYSSIRDFSDYLNDKIVELFNDPAIQWEEEVRVFKATFDSICEVLGDDAFCKYDVQQERFKGGLYVPAFEFLAVTIGRHDGTVDKTTLKERLTKVWQHINDNNISWQGRNHRLRVKETLGLGEMLYE